MTKYQLVFVKLETAMKKIIGNIEARKRLRLKRGFSAFKNHNFEFKIGEKLIKRRKLVCSKIDLTIANMVKAFNRYQTRTKLTLCFSQLKTHA